METVSYRENVISTYLFTCIFFIYYICQAEIIVICLKWLENVNKNYVQINQYFGGENQGNHNKGKKKERNMEEQKRGQSHRQVKGDSQKWWCQERREKYMWKSQEGKEKEAWRDSRNETTGTWESMTRCGEKK